MNVLEALQWAQSTLRTAGEAEGVRFDAPMLDAEVLLAAATGWPKARLFTRFDVTLPPGTWERFCAFVQRRAAREPVAYILGTKPFAGRSFFVNQFTLVPRPATETLVELAIQAGQQSDPESTIFADIGTGSGAIAVSVATETNLPVIASDISPRALAVAGQNARVHGVEGRVDLRLGDLAEPLLQLFEGLRGSGRRMPFDHLILCANLPYIPDPRWDALAPDIRRHEPRIALTSGVDGLDAYWKLFRQLREKREVLPIHLSVFIEIDPDQVQSAPDLIRHVFPAAQVQVYKDLDGFDRVVAVTGL